MISEDAASPFESYDDGREGDLGSSVQNVPLSRNNLVRGTALALKYTEKQREQEPFPHYFSIFDNKTMLSTWAQRGNRSAAWAEVRQ